MADYPLGSHGYRSGGTGSVHSVSRWSGGSPRALVLPTGRGFNDPAVLNPCGSLDHMEGPACRIA